jgi:hypothetical protein
MIAAIVLISPSRHFRFAINCRHIRQPKAAGAQSAKDRQDTAEKEKLATRSFIADFA